MSTEESIDPGVNAKFIHQFKQNFGPDTYILTMAVWNGEKLSFNYFDRSCGMIVVFSFSLKKKNNQFVD